MSGSSLYNAKEVNVIICMIPLVDGLDEGTFLKVTPVGDVADSEVGADGHVTIIGKNDPRFEIEVTLMYGSKHNEEFSALFAVMANNTTGAAIGPSLIKDNNGATLYAFSKTIPKTHAGTENGSAGKSRTWKFLAIGNYGGAISGGNTI